MPSHHRHRSPAAALVVTATLAALVVVLPVIVTATLVVTVMPEFDQPVGALEERRGSREGEMKTYLSYSSSVVGNPG